MIPDLVLGYCVNWALSCSEELQLRWDINLRPRLPAVSTLTREKFVGRQEGWWEREWNRDFSCCRLPFTRIHAEGLFFPFFTDVPKILLPTFILKTCPKHKILLLLLYVLCCDHEDVKGSGSWKPSDLSTSLHVENVRAWSVSYNLLWQIDRGTGLWYLLSLPVAVTWH